MRPHLRALPRSEFVRKYVRALISDGWFDLDQGSTIFRAVYSSSPIELCKLGRSLDSGLVMGVAPISLAQGLESLGLTASDFGRVVGSSFVLSDSDPFRIQWLRQLLLFPKKFPDAPEESAADTLHAYKKRIHESGRPKRVLDSDRELVARLLGDLPEVASLRQCKHGPGAVRDGERGREKWDWSYSFEYDSNFFCHELHELDHRQVSLPKLRRICRAITVPKDFRRDRVIAVEPKELMYVQQGLKAYLYTRLASASGGEIEFQDQARHCALLRDPDYASLDLSDASDMVSYKLCRRLIPGAWFTVLSKLRSQLVLIDGELVRARAMFTMGNALCFPIEALVHYIAVRRVVPSYYRVSVYGDDLIVPRKYAIWVMEVLREMGLKPSPSKSCYRTSFKESCGLDLFKDRVITPAYLRLERSGITNAQTALQLVSFQKHHWENGWIHSSRMVLDAINSFTPLPQTPTPHPWKLGGSGTTGRRRYNTLLQRLEYRIPQEVTHRTIQLQGWDALTSYFQTGTIEVVEKRDVPRTRFVWVGDSEPAQDTTIQTFITQRVEKQL